MTVATEGTQPWWESQPEGESVLLAFVKIDRKGSTAEWQDLPDQEVRRRRDEYIAGVAYVAKAAGAAQPLHWQGDGVMLFLADDDVQSAPVRAYEAAKLLWQRVRIDLNLSARIAVHAAEVHWDADTGRVAHPAIDQCGHLEQVAPVNSIVVSEDVYLCLPEKDQRELAPLGATARDGTPAYVYPSAAAERKAPDAFLPGDELALWDAFRRYVNSPEVRRLRYVGFRLTKKEPPSLDILDVFVPPEIERRRRDWRRRLRERTDAETAEQDEEDAGQEEFPFEWMQEYGESTSIERVSDVFRDQRSLIVLGDPGSGKTTLLRWLAVVAAGGRLNVLRRLGAAERLLPLPVSVGLLGGIRAEMRQRLGGEPRVVEAMACYFHGRNVGSSQEELQAFLHSRLEAGECLVLLDGLDEVTAEQRRVVHDWLETFAGGHPKNRYVVSSRPVGYAGFVLPEGQEVTLRPFNDEQVGRYVEAFCQAYHAWETGIQNGAGGRKAAEALMQAVKASPRLHALARNPFLLSGLALIHRAEGRLPRHRVQFYEIFARALCETWGAARRMVATNARRDIPFEEEAIPVLGELACRMHAEHPTGLAPEGFILDALTQILMKQKGVHRNDAAPAAAEFLRRCGEKVQMLLERGAGQWGFLHLTFLEFFAAAGLHAAEEFEEEAFKHLHDPRWEEIIRLGVGYLALCQKRAKAARQFVEKVFREGGGPDQPEIARALRRHVPLSVLLAAEAGDALPDDLQDEIAAAFVAWADEYPCKLAGRVRSEVSLTDFRAHLAAAYVPRLGDASRYVRATPADAVGQLKSPSAVEPLLAALKDQDAGVRGAAADALENLISSRAR